MSLDQIRVTPLKRIPVPGGDVLQAIKLGDPGYMGFGEVYFSIVDLNAIKAWKRHSRMTLNIVVPIGDVSFVFVNENGEHRLENVGSSRYVRLTVPAGIWFGFRGLAAPYSMVMNVADIAHDPDEVENKEVDQISYKWQ